MPCGSVKGTSDNEMEKSKILISVPTVCPLFPS